MARLRILVADDHAVVLDGIRLLINREPEWEVCCVARTGPEAIELALT
jgi:DNA-binding NarL/FixJ family response regulator